MKVIIVLFRQETRAPRDGKRALKKKEHDVTISAKTCVLPSAPRQTVVHDEK